MAQSNLDYRLHLAIARASGDLVQDFMVYYIWEQAAVLISCVKEKNDDLDDMLDIELQEAVLKEFYGWFE